MDPFEDEFSEEELNDLIALNRFNQIPELPKSTSPEEIKPVTRRPTQAPRTTTRRPARPQSRQPLQCFSCGSLLNAENNCTEFRYTISKLQQLRIVINNY